MTQRVTPAAGLHYCMVCGNPHPLELVSEDGPERRAFAAWAGSLGYRLMRNGIGAYRDAETRAAWCGWQARAARTPNTRINPSPEGASG